MTKENKTHENQTQSSIQNVSCSDFLQRLKKYEGMHVEYLYRGKYRKMMLMAVQLDNELINNTYKGLIGDVRLNYCDGKTREWAGFWTNKVENIRLLDDN